MAALAAVATVGGCGFVFESCGAAALPFVGIAAAELETETIVRDMGATLAMDSTAEATRARVLSSAADTAPLESGNLYINGSKTANNLTPRLTDTEGLSSWNTIDRGINVGGKGQCISAACLADGGLGAFKSGEPGHFDIRPLDQGGLDAWLAARAAGTEAESPFTQYLQAHAETVWNR